MGEAPLNISTGEFRQLTATPAQQRHLALTKSREHLGRLSRPTPACSRSGYIRAAKRTSPFGNSAFNHHSQIRAGSSSRRSMATRTSPSRGHRRKSWQLVPDFASQVRRPYQVMAAISAAKIPDVRRQRSVTENPPIQPRWVAINVLDAGWIPYSHTARMDIACLQSRLVGQPGEPGLGFVGCPAGRHGRMVSHRHCRYVTSFADIVQRSFVNILTPAFSVRKHMWWPPFLEKGHC